MIPILNERVVKIQCEFAWRRHAETDEVFIVLDGEMTIEFRDVCPTPNNDANQAVQARPTNRAGPGHVTVFAVYVNLQTVAARHGGRL